MARTSKAGNYPRRPGDPRLFRTQLLRHSNIKIIRIDEFRRYGRLVRLLEIETVSGGLLILSRWDLGTDPVEVLDALTAAGYAGRGQR
ncbi:membrane protein [Mycobacterium tuberculosis KT-0040]|nr:membrane protein [Mycobacterium tuberculosis KT-0040]